MKNGNAVAWHADGAFNSWDRLPYFTTVRDGSTVSKRPATNIAERNFIVSNYGADGGCLDNDDVSDEIIHSSICSFRPLLPNLKAWCSRC
jgi:hypothetical protein